MLSNNPREFCDGRAQARGTQAIVFAARHRPDRRQIIAPAIFSAGRRPAQKLRSATRAAFGTGTLDVIGGHVN
jgi:hypothetical protein